MEPLQDFEMAAVDRSGHALKQESVILPYKTEQRLQVAKVAFFGGLDAEPLIWREVQYGLQQRHRVSISV
jgi:hypothetical protein